MERHIIETVQQMQDFIAAHLTETPFPFRELYAAVGYSPRHADRLFRRLLHMTPREYVRQAVLSQSAARLLEPGATVLDTALQTGFNSHEGYTRAFSRVFGASPDLYRQGLVPIPLHIPYPIAGVYRHSSACHKEDTVERKPFICTVTVVAKPARKLLFQRSQRATDYWTYCKEMCCEWEGLFNSIPSRLDMAALLTLPDFLMKPGFSRIASGVELPADYAGRIPAGCETADLAPCDMLYFQVPFATDEEFFDAIGEAFRAHESYDPEAFGYTYADDAPGFNFGSYTGKRATLAFPARRLSV